MCLFLDQRSNKLSLTGFKKSRSEYMSDSDSESKATYGPTLA